MAEFRGGTTRVLITTDVWARGLDVQQARLTPPPVTPPLQPGGEQPRPAPADRARRCSNSNRCRS